MIIRQKDCPLQPWKNGLGRTREMAVQTSGTGGGFLWRVSVAEVDQAAPFSAFPGVDRVIALLDGDGFTMQLSDGRTQALTTPCAPFAFAGELGVAITLAGRPGRDFNLMLRRGRVRGGIEAQRTPGEHRLGADVVLAYCAHGTVASAAGTLRAGAAWLPGDDRLVLAADSTVLLVHAAAIA